MSTCWSRLRPAFDYADANGWTYEQSTKGKWTFSKPGRPSVWGAVTPSCIHAGKNLATEMRKADEFRHPRSIPVHQQKEKNPHEQARSNIGHRFQPRGKARHR